ncbi:UNVERIFIED_CONTAM: hypothetical protein FKN15_006379 [Acipenser sinensis]
MNALRLKELSNSDLYRRRQDRPDSLGPGGLLKNRFSNGLLEAKSILIVKGTVASASRAATATLPGGLSG